MKSIQDKTNLQKNQSKSREFIVEQEETSQS
jgi:hypothetical protein